MDLTYVIIQVQLSAHFQMQDLLQNREFKKMDL